MGDVHVFVWAAAAVIIFLVSFVTFWVLKKAYSKKWEKEETNKLN